MIPFSVVGGFLGAVKTTLINRLIRQPRVPRLAILVNDFGDIAIDAALLEAHGGETIALNNGCVCCSIGNDLGRALGRVLDSGMPLQHIVVEASGVAIPGRVMDVARVSRELEAAGTIVVVDGGALPAQLEDRWIADTVAVQLACADLFFVNKLDTLDAARSAATLARLEQDYPGVEQVQTLEDAWRRIATPGRDAGRERGASTDHAPFCSRSLVSERAVDPARLQAWLAGRDDIYRIKGWVRLARHETKLLQYAGNRVNWTPAEYTGVDNTRLVVIGRPGLPAVAEILDAVCNVENDLETFSSR